MKPRYLLTSILTTLLFVVLASAFGLQRVEAGVVDNLCNPGEAWDDGRCNIPGYEGASAEAWECGWYMARYWDKRFGFQDVSENCRRYIPPEEVRFSVPTPSTPAPPPIYLPHLGCGFNQTQARYPNQYGTRILIDCPANCSTSDWHAIFGTGTYTADSSVCYAAIQQGLISQAVGGQVLITITAGQTLYTGSTNNGITSRNWPADGNPPANGDVAYSASIVLSLPPAP